MVDRSAVGRVSEVVTVPIERGKVREFALACASHDAAYLDTANPVTPPTFLTTFRAWIDPTQMAHELADMHPRRTLAGGQDFVFHGPHRVPGPS